MANWKYKSAIYFRVAAVDSFWGRTNMAARQLLVPGLRIFIHLLSSIGNWSINMFLREWVITSATHLVACVSTTSPWATPTSLNYASLLPKCTGKKRFTRKQGWICETSKCLNNNYSLPRVSDPQIRTARFQILVFWVFFGSTFQRDCHASIKSL